MRFVAASRLNGVVSLLNMNVEIDMGMEVVALRHSVMGQGVGNHQSGPQSNQH